MVELQDYLNLTLFVHPITIVDATHSSGWWWSRRSTWALCWELNFSPAASKITLFRDRIVLIAFRAALNDGNLISDLWACEAFRHQINESIDKSGVAVSDANFNCVQRRSQMDQRLSLASSKDFVSNCSNNYNQQNRNPTPALLSLSIPSLEELNYASQHSWKTTTTSLCTVQFSIHLFHPGILTISFKCRRSQILSLCAPAQWKAQLLWSNSGFNCYSFQFIWIRLNLN